MQDIAISVKDLKKHFQVPVSKERGIRHLARSLIGFEKYSVKKVIDGISFDVKKGECFGILGPNGTGKSTLLMLLAGVLYPDEGTIDVSGAVVPLLHLGTGFQNELTARDNVYLYGTLLGLSDAQLNRKYKKIFKYAELEGFEHLPLKHFSSGMRSRLGFAIATEARHDILLLDEVLSVGDVAFKSKSKERILKICNSGSTVVIVSHSTGTITDICDRAMFLKNGKIGMIGDPEDVVDAYLDTMASSLGPGELVLAQKRKEKIDRKRTDRNDARIIAEQFDTAALHGLIAGVYDESTCAGVDMYLSQKRLTNITQLEEICADTKKDAPKFGTRWASLVFDLGDEERSRVIAQKLLDITWRYGLLHFCDEDVSSFFSQGCAEKEIPLSKQISLGILVSSSRLIPLVFDSSERVKLDSRTVQDILKNGGCDLPARSMIGFPPKFAHRSGVESLIEDTNLSFLLEIPKQDIEDVDYCLEFFHSLESPENLVLYDNSPIFVKEGSFDLYGPKIRGYGFYHPALVSRDSNQFYGDIHAITESFASYGKATSLKPDLFIHEVAKRNDRYFSGTKRASHIEVHPDAEALEKRHRIFGATLLLIQGLHDPLEYYRCYNIQWLTEQWFRDYIRVFKDPDQLQRGMAILRLLTNTTQIWVEREKSGIYSG